MKSPRQMYIQSQYPLVVLGQQWHSARDIMYSRGEKLKMFGRKVQEKKTLKKL